VEVGIAPLCRIPLRVPARRRQARAIARLHAQGRPESSQDGSLAPLGPQVFCYLCRRATAGATLNKQPQT
jgi:hypothetical protein